MEGRNSGEALDPGICYNSTRPEEASPLGNHPVLTRRDVCGARGRPMSIHELITDQMPYFA